MISIIIPIIRPEGAEKCITAITKYAGDIEYEIITAMDTNFIGCPKMVQHLVAKTQYDWVMFLGDDTIPQEGFLCKAVEKINDLPDRWGLVGLNDGVHDGEKTATHWMGHKKMLELTDGDFFHTGYVHQCCDNELTDIAREHGRYVWAEDAKITHNNALVNGDKDKFLEVAYSKKNSKRDKFLYLRRKHGREGVTLAIGIPITDEKIHTQFFLSFVMMDRPESCHLIFPTAPSGNQDIGRIRTYLCQKAIRLGCTHILMMDTDQVYHDQDMIEQLLAHGKDIVGGKVHRRYPPFEPILNVDRKHVSDDEIDKGGLIKVDSTGTGCLLIKLDALEHVDEPWFELTRKENGEAVGEDVGFCYKAKEAGLEVFVDCGVEIGHLASVQVNDTLYRLWKTIHKVKV